MKKERPILFSGEMVRAILDGRKTQTRRVVKYIPDLGQPENWCFQLQKVDRIVLDYRRYCPHGQPGDRLWVRETWAVHRRWNSRKPSTIDGERATFRWFRADGEFTDELPGRWRPSIHMPRWASRITLEVTDVRVERVRDIGNQDIFDEGMRCKNSECLRDGFCQSRLKQFIDLWNSINAKRPGCSWDENPWVWAITFEVIK